jgi:hypothetical protein
LIDKPHLIIHILLPVLWEESEGIGSGVITAEISKAPIVLNGTEEREVIVEGVVGSSRGEHRSNCNRGNVIVVKIIVFVPGDDDESPGREFRETRGHERIQELSCESQTRIVTVIVDVGGIIRILGQSSICKISVQLLGVHHLGTTSRILANIVETNEGIVLTIIGSLVGSCITLIRKILHITLPAHTTSLEEIYNSCFVPVINSIAERHPVISSNLGPIVGLRGMGNTIIVGKMDTHLSVLLEIGVILDEHEGLVLKLDDENAVEFSRSHCVAFVARIGVHSSHGQSSMHNSQAGN